jgi:phage/conjugal plasmid C-4 type zinc finger TraR family protein
MATGWAHEGAVLEQIDATVSDAVARARRDLLAGPSVSHCQDCGAEIPEGRRQALPGARHCVPCQEARDRQVTEFSGYNRRGSKDSQLR